MKTLLAAALLTLPMMASADSLTVEFGVFTKHIDYKEWMNEDNRLLAVEYNRGNVYVNTSTFINTYGNRTNTYGVGYKVWGDEHFSFDVLGGVVDGYTKEQLPSLCSVDKCLYVAPRVSLHHTFSNGLIAKTSLQLLGTAVSGTVGFGFKF